MRRLSSAFLLAASALASCGPGRAPAQAAVYQWRAFAGDDSQLSLWRAGRQLGNIRVETGEYFRRLPGGGFESEPSEPPVDAPGVLHKKCGCCQGRGCRKGKCGCKEGKRCSPECKCGKAADVDELPGFIGADGKPNFGIDVPRMSDVPEHILNGKEATKQQILEAIGKPNVPDDAGQMCVTIIGPEAARKQVVADLADSAALSEWRGKIKVQDYDAAHWAVRGVGFVTDGNPTIYCQAADGKVLWRQDSYTNAEAFAEVLRVVDPNYDKNKDPGPRKPSPGGDGPAAYAPVLWTVGAVVCFGFFIAVVVIALLLVIHLFRRKESV